MCFRSMGNAGNRDTIIALILHAEHCGTSSRGHVLRSAMTRSVVVHSPCRCVGEVELNRKRLAKVGMVVSLKVALWFENR